MRLAPPFRYGAVEQFLLRELPISATATRAELVLVPAPSVSTRLFPIAAMVALAHPSVRR
ncbi:hypothetical protein CA951_31125 [Rhodococcus sp. NCIMB 12038]|nr:hypothetical protein CA951_31125 [Rhodococcus sp. NCIMB 12038]